MGTSTSVPTEQIPQTAAAIDGSADESIASQTTPKENPILPPIEIPAKESKYEIEISGSHISMLNGVKRDENSEAWQAEVQQFVKRIISEANRFEYIEKVVDRYDLTFRSSYRGTFKVTKQDPDYYIKSWLPTARHSCVKVLQSYWIHPKYRTKEMKIHKIISSPTVSENTVEVTDFSICRIDETSPEEMSSQIDPSSWEQHLLLSLYRDVMSGKHLVSPFEIKNDPNVPYSPMLEVARLCDWQITQQFKDHVTVCGENSRDTDRFHWREYFYDASYPRQVLPAIVKTWNKSRAHFFKLLLNDVGYKLAEDWEDFEWDNCDLHKLKDENSLIFHSPGTEEKAEGEQTLANSDQEKAGFRLPSWVVRRFRRDSTKKEEQSSA